MAGFEELAAAFGLFIATHSVPALPALRARVVGLLGKRRYIVLHSLIASLSLIWLIKATLDAPTVVLWGFHAWARWVPILTMPLACILLVGGLTHGNPFSLGLGRRGWTPDRPGIVAVTRHPILWGAALWSGSHLFPNGEVRAVLLFGGLCLFSIAGTVLFDRRRARAMPDWAELASGTGNMPFGAICSGKSTFSVSYNLVKSILGGAALYLFLLFSHGPVLGLYPLG